MAGHDDPLPPCTSISLRPFSAAEILALRNEGRSDARFEVLLKRALRLQILAGLGRSLLDPEARMGAERAETMALLDLAQHQCVDHHQWRLKASMFRHVEKGFCNVSRMLRVALQDDAVRLGIETRHSAPDHRDPILDR